MVIFHKVMGRAIITPHECQLEGEDHQWVQPISWMIALVRYLRYLHIKSTFRVTESSFCYFSLCLSLSAALTLSLSLPLSFCYCHSLSLSLTHTQTNTHTHTHAHSLFLSFSLTLSLCFSLSLENLFSITYLLFALIARIQ